MTCSVCLIWNDVNENRMWSRLSVASSHTSCKIDSTNKLKFASRWCFRCTQYYLKKKTIIFFFFLWKNVSITRCVDFQILEWWRLKMTCPPYSTHESQGCHRVTLCWRRTTGLMVRSRTCCLEANHVIGFIQYCDIKKWSYITATFWS